MENRSLKTAARHFVVYIRFTGSLGVEPYDLVITSRILSVHVSSAALQGNATK